MKRLKKIFFLNKKVGVVYLALETYSLRGRFNFLMLKHKGLISPNLQLELRNVICFVYVLSAVVKFCWIDYIHRNVK